MKRGEGRMIVAVALVAVFDKDYDELGPFPNAPKLKAGAPVTRAPLVYNDAPSCV